MKSWIFYSHKNEICVVEKEMNGKNKGKYVGSIDTFMCVSNLC